MNIVWGSEREPELNQALHNWVCAKIDATRGLMPCTTMGVFQNGKLIAALVYHNWNPETGVIEISGAADSSRWLTKSVLYEMHAYPFNELKCQMVVQRNSERNGADGRGLQRMLKSYGYEQHRIPRLYGRDEAGILHCLTDDAWQANGYHGKPLEVSPDLKESVTA